MKKIIPLFIFLLFFVVKIEQFGKNYYWHAYKINDNKIITEIYQQGESMTENLAKFDWLKIAEFFNLTNKDWVLYEFQTAVEKKLKSDKKTYEQIAEKTARMTNEEFKEELDECQKTLEEFMKIK